MPDPIKYENQIDNVSYDDDPLEFYLACYRAGKAHQDDRRDHILENRRFWDGIDPKLEERKNNLDVKRSALFIHELRTASETRHSSVLDRVEADPMPIRMRLDPKWQSNTPEEGLQMQQLIREKEEQLFRQMRDSGYLYDVWTDQFYASEIQDIAWVKVTLEERTEYIPVRKTFDPLNPETYLYFLKKFKLPPRDMTIWKRQAVTRVRVDHVDYDEIFYDPQSTFEEVKFIGHMKWMTWDQVLKLGRDLGASKKEISKAKQAQSAEGDRDRMHEELRKDKNLPTAAVGYKDGKYLVVELWFCHYDNNTGMEEIRVMTTVANQAIFSDEPSPMKGIRFPFYPKVAFKRLGCMEGDSSVDLGRDSQRAYHDVNNAMLDLLSYGIFQEMYVPTSFQIKEKTKRGPGAITYCNSPRDINVIKPMTMDLTALMALSQMYAAKARQILNAPDVDQGIQENTGVNEKATKTRLRVMGAARRMRNVFKSAANDFITIAKMMISINQIDDPSWILPVTLEIPALSGVYSPDEELQQALMLLSVSTTSPLYSSPAGQMKLRKLHEDVFVKARVKDIDARLITEKELMDMLVQMERNAKDIMTSGGTLPQGPIPTEQSQPPNVGESNVAQM